jgi:mannan endo-1,4-beta-mannosidase
MCADQLNERVARGLDFVLSEASKYNIKLTLVLLNSWKDDGVQQWEQWCGTSGTNVKPRPDIDLRPEPVLNATERAMTPYVWLTSPKCQDQVKQFFTTLVRCHRCTVSAPSVRY